MNPIARLPYLPISLSSMQEGPLFSSSDARLVRAAFWMLDAAWRSDVPGSIAASFGSLAMITRLSETEVQNNYVDLTAGWDLREDGRLHHVDLSRLTQSIDDQFGSQLDVMSQGLAVAIQGVDCFDLLPTEQVKKAAKKRGKAQILHDFQPDTTSLAYLIKSGYITEEYREWVVGNFKDYALGKGLKAANWQAAFRNYVSSSITANSFRARFGVFPNATSSAIAVSTSQPLTPLDRLRATASMAKNTSFAQKTAAHNSQAMTEAMMGRRLNSEIHSQDVIYEATS